MIKIISDDKIPFLKGALEPFAEVAYLPWKDITNEVLKDADALLIRTRTKCNESLLKGTKVKFIGTATIGFDHIDTRYCDNNKIVWTNAPGCNSSSVQQYIAAALLKIASDFGFSLKDKTIGIVGVGNVGSKVERFARIMGMRVLLNDPPRARAEGEKDFVSLDNLLYESDIVTVHVPLKRTGEDKTCHLFNGVAFNKMKKGAWFINTSRGEVTDTTELKVALRSGKPAGTVLDVWENEPDIDAELLSAVHIATPHIAGYSTDGKANGTSMVVNSLCRHFGIQKDNWYPGNVPGPDPSGFRIDCKVKSAGEIMAEAVLHTYDIDQDNRSLRSAPAAFEKLRGDYRVRREFPAYSVDLKDGTESVRKMLEELGFNLI